MDISLTVKEALKTRAFYAIAIGLIAGTFTFSTVLTQIVPHLNNEGYTITSASLILSLTASFAIFGKLIFGYLAEKIQVRFVVASSLIGQALAMIVLVTEPKSAYIWLFISIYGLTYGGLGPLISLIVQDTFGLKHYASIQGLVTLASLISFFVGPLMAGMIFDATESYRPTFTIMIVLFIFGSIILTQAKPPKELQANK
jgi:MFS family permease